MPEDCRFHLIFYSSGLPIEMPLPEASPGVPSVDPPLATREAKKAAADFIGRIRAEGETDPTEALSRAFRLYPNEIVLLTDGTFERSVIKHIKNLNSNGTVKVHTIGFLTREGEGILKQIAAENGGQYRYVSEQDVTKGKP